MVRATEGANILIGRNTVPARIPTNVARSHPAQQKNPLSTVARRTLINQPRLVHKRRPAAGFRLASRACIEGFSRGKYQPENCAGAWGTGGAGRGDGNVARRRRPYPKLLRNFLVDLPRENPSIQARDAGANHRQRDAAYGPTEVDLSRCGAQPSTEDFFVEPDAISPHSWGCGRALVACDQNISPVSEVRTMGRIASHAEPRRMNGRDAAGPSPFEAPRAALRTAHLAPQGDGSKATACTLTAASVPRLVDPPDHRTPHEDK